MKKEKDVVVSYQNLWHKLIDCNMSRAQLRHATGMSTSTFAKLSRGEPVTMSTLAKICDVLKCDLHQIVNYSPKQVIAE